MAVSFHLGVMLCTVTNQHKSYSLCFGYFSWCLSQCDLAMLVCVVTVTMTNTPQLEKHNWSGMACSCAVSSASVAGGSGGSQQTGMLSVPIGVAGNITQFMAGVGLKGAQGIRPGTPFLISQVTSQNLWLSYNVIPADILWELLCDSQHF